MKKDNDPVGHSQLVQSIFHFEMIRHKLIDLAGDSEMLCVGIGASWKLGEKKIKIAYSICLSEFHYNGTVQWSQHYSRL